jgi:hypothetical protein
MSTEHIPSGKVELDDELVLPPAPARQPHCRPPRN